MAINKISQKTFAQSILNMKQANFSALLSQPMTWHTLSKTYKDRFLTMHLWLNDANRNDKLKSYPPPVQLNGTSACATVNDKYSLYGSSLMLSSQELNSVKKRQILNQNQTERLKMFFCLDPYPSADKMDLIANELDIDAKKVANWFSHQRQQNRLFTTNTKPGFK